MSKSQAGQNGKGSKSRITNKPLFDKNFQAINWSKSSNKINADDKNKKLN